MAREVATAAQEVEPGLRGGERDGWTLEIFEGRNDRTC